MKNFYSQAVALFLFFCLSACSIWSDGEEILGGIEGTWFNEQPIDAAHSAGFLLVQRYEISFLNDHKFQSARIVVTAVTGEVLGYRFSGDGSFEVKGEQLTMLYLHIYQHDDNRGLYSPLTELIPTPPDPRPLTVTFRIENDKMTWTYPPCGPNANCIGKYSFIRKN